MFQDQAANPADTVATVRARAEAAANRAGVRIEEFDSAADLSRAARIWDEVWDSSTGSVMPIGLLVALAHSGHLVTGAIHDGVLVGAAAGFHYGPGAEPGFHSHIAGVLPSWRGRGVGQALKWHQAWWCITQGVDRLSWTFDPLVGKNAAFNLTQLGARVSHYSVDLYGPMADGLNAGQPTDRLWVDWWPATPRPEITGQHGPGGALLSDTGERVADAPTEQWQWATIPVPADIGALRHSDPATALVWRMTVREVFIKLLNGDWEVVGFRAKEGYLCRRRASRATAEG